MPLSCIKDPNFFPERVMGAIAKNVIVVLFRYLNCYHRFYLSKLWGKCSLFYLKNIEINENVHKNSHLL